MTKPESVGGETSSAYEVNIEAFEDGFTATLFPLGDDYRSGDALTNELGETPADVLRKIADFLERTT